MVVAIEIDLPASVCASCGSEDVAPSVEGESVFCDACIEHNTSEVPFEDWDDLGGG